MVDRRHRPVAGAEVILHRPGKSLPSPLNRWLEDTDEAMARTYTDRDGRFVVTTRSGYATLATASAPSGGVTDPGEAAGSVGGTNDPKRGPLPKELLIELR